MFWKQKQNDNVFSQYPCSVFLHNALRFITEGKPEVAYEEICWALVRSGAELSKEEKTRFEELRVLKERERE